MTEVTRRQTDRQTDRQTKFKNETAVWIITLAGLGDKIILAKNTNWDHYSEGDYKSSVFGQYG